MIVKDTSSNIVTNGILFTMQRNYGSPVTWLRSDNARFFNVGYYAHSSNKELSELFNILYEQYDGDLDDTLNEVAKFIVNKYKDVWTQRFMTISKISANNAVEPYTMTTTDTTNIVEAFDRIRTPNISETDISTRTPNVTEKIDRTETPNLTETRNLTTSNDGKTYTSETTTVSEDTNDSDYINGFNTQTAFGVRTDKSIGDVTTVTQRNRDANYTENDTTESETGTVKTSGSTTISDTKKTTGTDANNATKTISGQENIADNKTHDTTRTVEIVGANGKFTQSEILMGQWNMLHETIFTKLLYEDIDRELTRRIYI